MGGPTADGVQGPPGRFVLQEWGGGVGAMYPTPVLALPSMRRLARVINLIELCMIASISAAAQAVRLPAPPCIPLVYQLSQLS